MMYKNSKEISSNNVQTSIGTTFEQSSGISYHQLIKMTAKKRKNKSWVVCEWIMDIWTIAAEIILIIDTTKISCQHCHWHHAIISLIFLFVFVFDAIFCYSVKMVEYKIK